MFKAELTYKNINTVKYLKLALLITTLNQFEMFKADLTYESKNTFKYLKLNLLIKT